MTEDKQGSPWGTYVHRTHSLPPGSSRRCQGHLRTVGGQMLTSETSLGRAVLEGLRFQDLLNMTLCVSLKRLRLACPTSSRSHPHTWWFSQNLYTLFHKDTMYLSLHMCQGQTPETQVLCNTETMTMHHPLCTVNVVYSHRTSS